MLISEAQERERYICYCHKPIVQRWTTPSSSWRRWRCRWRRRRPLRQRSAGVFPPPICSLLVSVSCFSRVVALLSKNAGGLFIYVFLGHEDALGRRIDANGATRAKRGGPTRPLYLAAWGTPFCPSSLRSLASFAPRSSSFQNNDPRKFIAHYDVVKALK